VTPLLPFFDEILHKAPTSPVRLNPEVPDHLENIINKSLEKDTEVRCQSAKEVLADLKRLKRDTSGESVSAAVPAATKTKGSYLWPAIVGGPGLIVVLLALYWPFTSAPPAEAIDSIAVLPFENLSNDPELEYLSDGIAEGIINSLSQLKDLKVISRASSFRYRGADIDPQATGSDLGVRALVMGRVLLRGEDLSIGVDLVDVEENTQLWGAQYDRNSSEILEIRREIAKEISNTLRLRLTAEEETQLAKTYTENTQAHEAYLKGKFQQEKRTLESIQSAIQHFEEAIRKDPNYALAYAELSYSYRYLGNQLSAMPLQEAMPKAEEMAMKALEIDNRLAEAHVALGDVRRYHYWDWAEAEKEYQLATELDPSSFEVPYAYSFLMTAMGRLDDAIALSRRAQQLDPLNPVTRAALSFHLLLARRYEESIQEARAALDMNPNFQRAYIRLATTYEAMGLYREAATALQAWLILRGASEEEVAGLADAAVLGAEGYWQWWLDYYEERAKRGGWYVPPTMFASALARLGEKDQAFEWLEKAYEQRDADLMYLKNPVWDPLRDKIMTNLDSILSYQGSPSMDSILKSRDNTLLTKVCII